MEKKQKILSFAIVIVLAALIIRIIPVGKLTGGNKDYIIIGPKTYVLDKESPYSSLDKGYFIGFVTDGRHFYKVYSVKGDRSYICRDRSIDFAFYEKIK